MPEYIDPFIPDEPPESTGLPADHPPWTNLAENEDIVKNALKFSQKKFEQYKSDRSPYDSTESATPGKWVEADYMFNCGLDTTRREAKQKKDTLSDTGSAAFFRQVVTIAAQLITVYNHRRELGKYTPIQSSSVWLDTEDADHQAKQHTAIFHKALADAEFDLKFTNFAWLLGRYGNHPMMASWLYRTKKFPDRVKTTNKSGQIEYKHVEREKIEANRPDWQFVPIESVYADVHIGTMEKQQCIIITSEDEISNLYGLQRDGQITNVDKINKTQMYSGADDNSMHQERQASRGGESGNDTETGLIKRKDVLLKIPVGLKKGKTGEKASDYEWDEKKHEPKLYWMLVTGELGGSIEGDNPNATCLVLRENPDSRRKCPIKMIHLFPGNDDELYHISPAEISAPDYDQIVTEKNMANDDVILQHERPLLVAYGETFSKDLSYGASKIIMVANTQTSIREMDVKTNIGDTLGMINYSEGAMDRALATNEVIAGEFSSGRHSASESVNVYSQAQKPHNLIASYVLRQVIPEMAEYAKTGYHI